MVILISWSRQHPAIRHQRSTAYRHTMPSLFDAHLDLAYLAQTGRDMTCPDLSTCGGTHQPASITFPSLRAGNVTACLGTIFTEAIPHPTSDPIGPFAYPLGAAEAAHRAGLRQLDLYHQWQRDGLLSLSPRRGTKTRRVSGAGDPAEHGQSTTPLRVGILMECADPIRSPDELPFWIERGVVAIGLAWVHGSRYAAGNAADPSDPAAGLTDLGRALVRAMDALGVVHDLSHLSQRATDQLLELTASPVIASHSNCRALLSRDAYPNARQRHLADATIAEIGRRGGVIGLNLCSDFLDSTIKRGESASPTSVVDHAKHIAQIVGHRRAVGLGTDMDGGFGANCLPLGIRTPAALGILLAGLSDAGWNEPEVDGFAERNWSQFWGIGVSEGIADDGSPE